MDHVTTCCVDGCQNAYKSHQNSTEFYSLTIGGDLLNVEQREMWIEAVRRINGADWLPDDHQHICSRHFIGNKKSASPNHPSFIPSIFSSREQTVEMVDRLPQYSEHNDRSMDNYSELSKLTNAYELPDVSGSASNASFSVRAPSSTGAMETDDETCILKETFRQLVCRICPAILSHRTELRIEGTVGVTIDGGPHVILVHFSDTVRKADSHPVSDVMRNETKCAVTTSTSNLIQNGSSDSEKTEVGCLAENYKPDVDECLPRSPGIQPVVPFTVSECNLWQQRLQNCLEASKNRTSMDLRLPSDDLASTVNPVSQKSQNLSSSPSNAINLSTSYGNKTPDEPNSVKPPSQQRTLLRELLCSPLPPKRQRTDSSLATTPPLPQPTMTKIREVVQQRSSSRTTANSTVLGELLKKGSIQYISEFHPVFSALQKQNESQRGSGPGRRRGCPRRPPSNHATSHTVDDSSDATTNSQSYHNLTNFHGHSTSFGNQSPSLAYHQGQEACAGGSRSAASLTPTDYHYSRLLHGLAEKRCDSVAVKSAVSVADDLNSNNSSSTCLGTVSVKNEVVDSGYGLS